MTRPSHIHPRAFVIFGFLLCVTAGHPTRAATTVGNLHRLSPVPTGITSAGRFSRMPPLSSERAVLLGLFFAGRGRWLLWPSFRRRVLTVSSMPGPVSANQKQRGWTDHSRPAVWLDSERNKTTFFSKRWSRIFHEFKMFPEDFGQGWLQGAHLRLSAELAPISQSATAPEDLECLADLMEENVDFRIGPTSPGIRTPVTIKTWILGGVRYVPYYPDQHFTQMDCRLVLALVRAGPVLQSLGVRQVVWSSAYRPPDRPQLLGAKPYNKHTEGLAIDVHMFRFGGKIEADVARNYEKGLGFQRDASCLGRPSTQEGLLLRLVACRLDASDLFQEILTPDYDSNHWNHFHLAVFRPGETRRHKHTALLEVPLEKIPGWALARWGHARPNLELWKDVAERPWPKKYVRLASKVGARRPGMAISAMLSLILAGGHLTETPSLPTLQRDGAMVSH